jgi:hypothetical protein
MSLLACLFIPYVLLGSHLCHPSQIVMQGMFSPTEPCVFQGCIFRCSLLINLPDRGRVPTPLPASSATDPIPLPDPPFETTRHHVATYVVELLLDRCAEAVTGGIYVIRGLRRDRALVDREEEVGTGCLV